MPVKRWWRLLHETAKTGWSLGMAIKRPLKCEPLNFGLPMQMSESYPWQPE